MGDRPFAYVCSPLRGDVEANMERAREYSRQVFEAGYTPITPHIYFPQFLKDDIPEERAAGMKMGESLIPFCRVLVVCSDTISEGMKQEIKTAQGLGIETCALVNIPPIPTLENYRDDLPNLDNFGIAVSLIEGMTDCRFRYVLGDSYIHPGEDSYFAVNKLVSFDRDYELFRVTFNATLKRMGGPMDTADVLKLQQETYRIRELLILLSTREYVLTPDEMQSFNDAIRQRDAVKDTPPREKSSVIEKIAAARDQTAVKPGNGKKSKSHGEEL